MLAQVTTLQLQPGTLDEFVRYFQDLIAPATARQPGFNGSILLVDSLRGKVLAVGFWETEADLLGSELGTVAEQHSWIPHLLASPPAREVYRDSSRTAATAASHSSACPAANTALRSGAGRIESRFRS